MCSFSNLFSPSSKSVGKQPSALPDVRYSALQGDDNGNAELASHRSPRIVRFREEDMYWHFIYFQLETLVFCCTYYETRLISVFERH